ncbi:hypothetical protein CEE69_06445 [Rhodopirellula bahusiensis]|uniref:Uncharacterized protein n=1 Tax=Rhodopirellula bahusiensis TaxID=2014065 RepID=A0A2G1WB85_9BACT|nr:hypothetical protein CEE69_06445 [Rhodopirellula bahusiensis]
MVNCKVQIVWAFWGRVICVTSHSRLLPSRTVERRRLSSPQTSFWEMCVI